MMEALTPYAVGLIFGYLAYNHRRSDRLERDVAILQNEMKNIAKNIDEIKRGIEKLIERNV